MSYLCSTKGGASNPMDPGPKMVVLTVRLGCHVPSKKNHHYPSADGKRILIDKNIKQRMVELENAIACELFSLSAMLANGTPSECWRQLLMLLSGLSDDSIAQVPSGSWDVRYVPKGEEGVEIHITEITESASAHP